ncbi:MAG TPA: LarC family nickel insertion protein [Actinomycetota bacterium]
MSRLLFVDPIGGAAGDMLLAALLDAGAPEQLVFETVEAVLPGRFIVSTEEVRRGGLRATALQIDPRQEVGAISVGDLLSKMDDESIPEPVRSRARLVLDRLGTAEAKVHRLGPGDAIAHALREGDTSLDVVGIAVALHALDVDRMIVSALPLGSGGSVAGPEGHGWVPMPAPATVELLRGFPVRGAGRAETVTPTAAAVFAALGEPGEAVPEMTLEAVGYGAGLREDPDRPNVVRVLVGTPARISSGIRIRELTLLEANLDDLTPELVADATEALFAAGALDVWTTPVQMKKGRAGVVLAALCDQALEPVMTRLLFETTSTFGVRSRTMSRSELERRTVAVPVAGGSVRVKVGLLEGRVLTATPEHDDVVALAKQRGRPVREMYQEAAAAAASLRQQEVSRA